MGVVHLCCRDFEPQDYSRVRIAYAFYKNDQLPPESFWDYSKLYDLDVKRDQKCDTTVEAISSEKNVDEHGNELPAAYVLRSVKNAPANALQRNAYLPCYVLSFGQYRQVDPAPAR
jgi:hypothetical protein